MDRSDVREKLYRELQVNAFWHSNSILMIKRSAKWLGVIDSILLANDVPSDFKYLCVAESGLQNVISPARAVGYWQLLKGTAKDMDLIVNSQVDQRYDPVFSTIAASKYLKMAHKKFGDWTLVAAAYNMGIRATTQALKNQKAKTYFDLVLTEEPSRYVFRILAIKELLENPYKYGFSVGESELNYYLESRKVEVKKSVTDWSTFAEENGTNFYQLKQLNPWIRKIQFDN